MKAWMWWDLGVLVGIIAGSWLLIRYEHLVIRFLRWVLRVNQR